MKVGNRLLLAMLCCSMTCERSGVAKTSLIDILPIKFHKLFGPILDTTVLALLNCREKKRGLFFHRVENIGKDGI